LADCGLSVFVSGRGVEAICRERVAAATAVVLSKLRY
jgi:hypothetical protein